MSTTRLIPNAPRRFLRLYGSCADALRARSQAGHANAGAATAHAAAAAGSAGRERAAVIVPEFGERRSRYRHVAPPGSQPTDAVEPERRAGLHGAGRADRRTPAASEVSDWTGIREGAIGCARDRLGRTRSL